ncbi:hypothetical protein A2Z56_02545 [Candidatus Kaiserbacteria bacterium RIFCSPHIGHO2_12_45_16]|nr:MAG: hypothetical protein A2Z56_02545 [Candidatus Kaiserbacteria bacterium RIFCSPHIGHO2_12_45_16]
MGRKHTAEEIEAATKLTDDELAFVDDMAQAIFDQAAVDEIRPYVLMALCGAIASNVVSQSEGETDVETVLKFVELATKSQLE